MRGVWLTPPHVDGALNYCPLHRAVCSISHEPDARRMHVYGYSVAFGPADHVQSVSILKARYPEYTITHSHEGY